MLMGVLKSLRPARCKVRQQVAVKLPSTKNMSHKTLCVVKAVSLLPFPSLPELFRTRDSFDLQLWLQEPQAFDPFCANLGSVEFDDFKAINSS